MASAGLADMAFVTVPHPMGMIALEEIRAKADAAFDEIVKTATDWKPAADTAAIAAKPAYPAEKVKIQGSYAELNQQFAAKGWSIGMPVVPPTTQAVEAMLKGTKHKPDEVVWLVTPRMGQLTVELVAAYGVMAGCQPEHMPLLLATAKALADPAYDWRGASTTTAAASPLIVVSGPIIDKLKINNSTGEMAGQQPASMCVGYFVNLVGDIMGGSLPPDIDKSTHGTRGDLVAMVVAENDKANPWQESLAVERGFKPTDSVVTAMAVYPGTVNVDHTSVKGTDILNSFSAGMAGVASGIASCYAQAGKPYVGTGVNANSVNNVMLLVGPEHAATMFTEFKTKQAVKEYLVANTKLPYKEYAPDRCYPPKEAGEVAPDTMLPRWTTPGSVHIVVTGGAGKQSQIWPNFVTGAPVSALVEAE